MTRGAQLYQPTEAEFQDAIVEFAQACGWRVAHFRPAKTARGWRTPVAADGQGFPDLVMVRPPRVIFAEVKSAKGGIAPSQRAWLESLLAARGVDTYVWRPKDWDDVVATLKRKESR